MNNWNDVNDITNNTYTDIVTLCEDKIYWGSYHIGDKNFMSELGNKITPSCWMTVEAATKILLSTQLKDGFHPVNYMHGEFVTIDGGKVISSPDGETWNKRKL